MKYLLLLLGLAACTAGSGGAAMDAGGSDAGEPDARVSSTGVPDPAQSSIETDHDVLAVTEFVHMTIVARDALGDPIVGASVQLTADGSENTLSIPLGTNAAGLTKATWRTSVAETKTVTATANGVMLATHTVTFVPGPATHLVFVQSPATAVAGAPLAPAIEVEVEDFFGNLVPSVAGFVFLSIAANPGSTSVRGPAIAPMNGGRATFTGSHLDVAAPGYTLRAQMSGVGDATSAAFDILPGVPDMTQSSIAASPGSLDADGSTTELSVRIANSYGVAIADVPVALSATGSNNTLASATGTTSPTGTLIASLSSSTPEAKVVTAQAGAVAVTTTVTFHPPGCRPLLPGLPWTPLAASAEVLQVADVDGDGHPDVIVGEPYQRIAVYRGRGDGGLFPAADLPLPLTPIAGIAVGDFNGDGDADLAISEDSANRIEIALGGGSGHFAVTSSISFATRTGRLVVGDFNHDGHPDLAATLPYAQQLAIELGTGTGAFTSGQVTSGIDAFDLKAVDLDADGELDLVLSTPVELAALLGAGDGTFAPPIRTSVVANGRLFVGDFNKDTTPDVAIASSAGFIASYLGQRDGHFQAIGGTVQTMDDGGSLAIQPAGAGVADLDTDGNLDIVLGSGSIFSILNGAGDGTFTLGATYAGDVAASALVDMNGDGAMDVVGLASRLVGVIAGTPGGGFVAPRVHAGPAGQLFGTAADFDGNGQLDLIRWESSGISILLSQPDGSQVDSPSSVPTLLPYDAVAGDVTDDGFPDVVLATSAATGVRLQTAVGLGDGSFDSFTSQLLPATYVTKLQLARLDPDNGLDLVMTKTGSTGIWIALGQGTGRFATPQQISTTATWARVADLSGDGIDDVITASSDDTSLIVYRGNGLGGVVPPVAFSTEGSGGTARTGDVDGDGTIDVVMLHEDPTSQLFSIAVMRGLGGGALGPPIVTRNVALPSDVSIQDVAVVDLSSDAVLDLVVHSTEAVTIFEGYGDGYFRRTPFHYGLASPSLVISDHDQNQSPDLAFSTGMGIGVALNQGCTP